MYQWIQEHLTVLPGTFYILYCCVCLCPGITHVVGTCMCFLQTSWGLAIFNGTKSPHNKNHAFLRWGQHSPMAGASPSRTVHTPCHKNCSEIAQAQGMPNAKQNTCLKGLLLKVLSTKTYTSLYLQAKYYYFLKFNIPLIFLLLLYITTKRQWVHT